MGAGAIALAFATPLFLAAPAEADAFPSWDDVRSARGSEAAKKKQIGSLKLLISQLERSTASAAADAEKAGTEFQVARDALDLATGDYERVSQQQREAQKRADELGDTVGQVAVALSRPGGASNLTAHLVLDEKDPGEFLKGLSTSAKIGEQVDKLYSGARTATNEAEALADQAAVAKRERTRLAGDSQAALDRAVTASAAATAAEQAQEENLGVMRAQLATLSDDRLSIEDGYEQGVEARAEIARKAAAEKARREAAAATAAAAAAAQRPPVSGGGTGGGSGSGGSGGPGSGSGGSGGPGGSGGSGSVGTGWARPITSYSFYQAYGYRIHPVYGDLRLHAGADYSSSCGTAIYAAKAGTVTYAGPSGGYGNLIIVDHGGGVTSAYGHVYSSGIYVHPGQAVGAGQNIAGVGSAGVSTGCHLHFEIRLGGVATDPVAYMASH